MTTITYRIYSILQTGDIFILVFVVIIIATRREALSIGIVNQVVKVIMEESIKQIQSIKALENKKAGEISQMMIS